jgi:outer membrane protein TolC
MSIFKRQKIFSGALTFVLLYSTTLSAQNKLTIDECYTLAKNNFPVIKQKELIAKSNEYTLSNIEKGIMPQLSFSGQTTYQSDVTTISIPIPGLKFTPPSKDQYKLYAEVSQPLTDLYTIKQQKELQKANTNIQQQSVEVELYKLKDRINQIFFGILLLDEQVKLNDLVDKDLETGMNKVSAAIKNGVDYKSSLDKLRAESIKNNQREIELKAQRKAYTDMLSYFVNKQIDENTIFEKPSMPGTNLSINRPEVKFYDTKNMTYAIQKKIIQNRNIPKFSVFLQGGIGQPSPLNMISNNFSTYYLGGLRLNWSIMNLYTQKNERSLLSIDKSNNDLQKEIFLFNTNLQIRQQNNELSKLSSLIKTDDELVDIRYSVKNTSKVQLENGIITSNDYIKEVNAEDQARQNKLLHEIQLLTAQYSLQNTTGN